MFNLSYQRKRKAISKKEIEKEIESEEKKESKKIEFKKRKIDSHEKAEAFLLSLGMVLGYDTYTPDKGRTVEGQKLGDIATLKELPYFGSEKIMETAENIDVVWVKEEWPEMFFEVEHSTGVTPGLLRIYQVAEKLNVKCFIIAPREMIQKFKKEIEKPPFNKIKEKYRFKSYEDLEKMFLVAGEFKETYKNFFEEK